MRMTVDIVASPRLIGFPAKRELRFPVRRENDEKTSSERDERPVRVDHVARGDGVNE